MQAYMHLGQGFAGTLLTHAEYQRIVDLANFPDENEVKIQFRSFTEDDNGKDWGTVVLQDLGPLQSVGKFASLAELQDWVNAHKEPLDASREAILDELTRVGLGHLADKVDLVIFIDNY